MAELDEARKELEKEPTKKGLFGLFGKSNKEIAKKKDWETYQASENQLGHNDPLSTPRDPNEPLRSPNEPLRKPHDDVLFDVDAIRKELAIQAAEERSGRTGYDTYDTTTLAVPGSSAQTLRQTKSFDQSTLSGGVSLETNRDPLPQPPAKKDYYYYSGDESEDEFGNKRNRSGEEIQMTFATWDDPPPPTQQTLPKPSAGLGMGHRSVSTSVLPARSSSYFGTGVIPTTTSINKTPVSTTTPFSNKGQSVEEEEVVHNAWADYNDDGYYNSNDGGRYYNDDYYDDEDDEDFGKEKEVELSFA